MMQEPSILWSFMKLFLALPVVGLLAYISLKIHHQYFYKYQMGKSIEVLERVSLSNKSFLFIVRIGKEYMVLGTSDNNMQVIKTLDESEVDGYLHPRSEITLKEAMIMNYNKWKKEK